MVAGYKPFLGFMGGGGTAITVSVTATDSSASSTIAVLPSAIAGDFAILVDLATNSSGSSISAVTPTNWTTIANSYLETAGDVVRLMTSYKLLTESDIGTFVTGMNSTKERKRMILLRPSRSIVGVTASTWNSEATAGNPSTQTVSASGVSTPLIVIAAAGVSASAVPSFTTETPAMTNVVNADTNIGLRVGYTVYNSSPSDQSIDIGDSDVNALQSGYVRFT